MIKLKIYVMHSDKIDYKNEIYKPLLEINLNKEYNLILPMSNKYINNYIKELINDSDVIICNLTKFNWFQKIELKWANKLNKPIYYFIDNNDAKKNKYNNLKLNIYNNKEEFSLLVKTILDSLNKRDLILKRDNIYSLGNIEKSQ